MPRGRPSGRLSNKSYIQLGARYLKPSQFKEMVKAISKKEAKKETKKEIKKDIHAGRPTSTTQSMQILGGKMRIRLAKSRTIKIGNKMVRV